MAKSKDWTIDIWDTKHVVKVLFNVNLLPVKRCPKNIFFTFPFSRGFPASVAYLLSFYMFAIPSESLRESTRKRRSLITMRCIAWNLIYSKVFISSFYRTWRRRRRIIKCHKWLWFGFCKYTTYQKHRTYSLWIQLPPNISRRKNAFCGIFFRFFRLSARKIHKKSNEVFCNDKHSVKLNDNMIWTMKWVN